MDKENISIYRRIIDKKLKKGIFYIKDKYPIVYTVDGKKYFFIPGRMKIAVTDNSTLRFSTGIEFNVKFNKGEINKSKGKIEVTNIKEANRFKASYIEMKRAKLTELEEEKRLELEELKKFAGKIQSKLVSESTQDTGLLEAYLLNRNSTFRYRITKETEKQYTKSVKSFVRKIGNKYLNEYTVDDCVTYLVAVREELSVYSQSGIKDLSAKKYFDNLNRIFKWALQNEYYLKDNPWGNSRVRQEISVKKRQVLRFTPDQFKDVFSHIKNQKDKDFVLWALLTGMRQNEIVNLKVEDVSILKKSIHIQTNEEHRTKTDRPRKIPLSNELIPIVKNALYKKQTYVFESHDRKVIDKRTGKIDIRVNDRKISDRFSRIVREVIPGSILSFQNLRSTFGSWLLEEGSSMERISKLLGHEDIKTTQKHYADCAAINFTTEIRTMSKILRRASERDIIQARQDGKWKYKEVDSI